MSSSKINVLLSMTLMIYGPVSMVTSTTHDPTVDPTNEPTDATIAPTSDPTIYPTFGPTPDPTIYPTSDPTIAPTSDPTIYPSFAPSISPSVAPSVSPSMAPSMSPSMSPSLGPSVSPSFSPSSNPTAEPTELPTVVPTSVPTTSVPTTSVPTTSIPTTRPTPASTSVPTTTPSAASPTASPSTPTTSPATGGCDPLTCNDGDYCNGEETCINGKCVSGIPIDCGFAFICDSNTSKCVRNCDSFDIDGYLQCSQSFLLMDTKINGIDNKLQVIDNNFIDLRRLINETNNKMVRFGKVKNLNVINSSSNQFEFDGKDLLMIGLLLTNMLMMFYICYIPYKNQNATYSKVSVYSDYNS